MPASDPDNAFVARCEVAGSEDGCLTGITFAVKDNIEVAGLAFTAGHPLFEDRHGDSTAPAIQRLLNAGAACVGMTTTDAGGFGATTPQTANPVAPGHIVGGSSGGSAAAVARGHCDFAVGTDTGGSVRIPAACTGLLGFKPTFGRVPNDGVWPLAPELDHVGLIARDPVVLARAGRALLAADTVEHETGETSLPKIGIERDAGGAWHPAITAAVDGARDALATAGYETVTIEAPDRAAIAEAHGVIVLAEAARIYEDLTEEERDRLGDAGRRALRYADSLTVEIVATARRSVAALLGWRDAAFGECDLIASPTLPVPLPGAGEPRVMFAGRERPVVVPMTFMTCLANLTGDPVVSIPVGEGTGPDATSIQFMAPGGADEALLTRAAGLVAALKGPSA